MIKSCILKWGFLFILLLCITLALLFWLNYGTDEKYFPRIQIRDGKLRGIRMYTTKGRPVDAFIGIPYALPPVGELRFKAPVDPIPWLDERDAKKDPSPCVQFSSYSDNEKNRLMGSEDCLFVNVFKPKDPEYSKPLPVLVFIHGGGLYKLSSSIEDYGPEVLLNKDIVLVTFNYRLEILGFLSTENDECPGNYGFKDQLAVLKWVRENIHYFGGDPNRVTLYGHSAGAYSVQYHMLSPLSKGLFQKAISSSGTIYTLYPFAKGLAAKRTQMLAEYTKCPTHNLTLMVECLRNVSVEEMFSHLYKFQVWNGMPELIFGPVIELENGRTDNSGPFITKNSLLFSNITIPWIVGLTSEDGLIGAYDLSSDSLGQFDNRFNELAPMVLRYLYRPDKEALTDAVKWFYFGGKHISRQTLPQLTNIFSDTHFLFGILSSLYHHKGPVYLYYFSHRGQYGATDNYFDKRHPEDDERIISYIKKGVSHGDELQYIFPMLNSFKNKKLEFTPIDKVVSERFIQSLTDFIYDRESSHFGWKKSSLENLEYLHMDTNNFTMTSHLLYDRAQFWSSRIT